MTKHFDLTKNYPQWRDWKLEILASMPVDPVEVGPDVAHDHHAVAELLRRCERYNMAIYQFDSHTGLAASRKQVLALAERLNLKHLDRHLCSEPDGLALLQVTEQKRPAEYIPYTNNPINWHTDGYYNDPNQQIHAFMLHCVRSAASGGANRLLDPELLYIRLYDENPGFIHALMQDRVMTIPKNVEDGELLRPEQSGPVFTINPGNRNLHTRYTARTRSIHWLQNDDVQAAVQRISELLKSDNDLAIKHRLSPGQGLVCNNVLHTRDAFSDSQDNSDQQRLYLRARFFDRVA